MKVSDFDFDLPETLIAQAPARPRESARLLHVSPNAEHGLRDLHVSDLPDLVRPGDVMVFNDTRVIPARLAGKRGAAAVEVTLIKRDKAAAGPAVWSALARPGRRLKAGDRIDFAADFAARVLDKTPGGEVVLEFDRDDDALWAALETYGIMPLPPYIKRAKAQADVASLDRADYQTAYARNDGAVAAPTAGLHFTDDLLAALAAHGVSKVFVTLHVGMGTFQPVKVDDTDDHVMHSEWGTVSAGAAAAINAVRANGGRIVCVGTTSLRLIESAAGEDSIVHPFEGSTDIFITPGYRFKAVDALMTNFHLPKSTLFMLVSAFAGLERMRAAYAHAIARGYRFYSYGDACFLERA